MQDFLLISLGAVLGANIRLILYRKLEKLGLRKDFFILIINGFSSFLLGLLLPSLSRISSLNFSDQLVSFFLIGFIGSLSTFSSFVYNLFELFLQSKFSRALKLFVFSSVLGIISLSLGFVLASK